MIRSIIAVVFSVLMFGYAFAEQLPPKYPFESIDWQALSHSKPTTGLTMGKFKVIYEKTTLDEVKRKIGLGQIFHQGDAAASQDWLCYSYHEGRLWILSGEMGGGNTILNVSNVSGKFAASSDCPNLPKEFQPLSFGPGLRLGASESSILKILGQPSHRELHWLSFDYAGKDMTFCKPDGGDVTNWVLFKVRKMHVVTILAGQVSSC
jgi:hypothetical protein